MKTLALALLTTVLICSCASAPKAQPVRLIYQVQPGDTISQIYRKYRIPLSFPYMPFRRNCVIYPGEYITVVYPAR